MYGLIGPVRDSGFMHEITNTEINTNNCRKVCYRIGGFSRSRNRKGRNIN